MSEPTPAPTRSVYATNPMWAYDEPGTDVFERIRELDDEGQSELWRLVNDHVIGNGIRPHVAVLEDLLDRVIHWQSRPDRDPEAALRYRHKNDRRPREFPPGQVVYYVRFGDRVKIGYSGNLERRLNGIPWDELLATEPGDYELEADRHHEFAEFRVIGEWFRYEGRLREHVQAVRVRPESCHTAWQRRA